MDKFLKIYSFKAVFVRFAVLLGMWLPLTISFAKPESALLIDAPVTNFTLPLFGSDGKKTCEIHGEAAKMLEEDLFSVTNSKLSCLSSEQGVLVFSVLSESATIQPSLHKGFGQGGFKIVGQNFHGQADEWEFLVETKKFTAKNNVKIFFDGEL